MATRHTDPVEVFVDGILGRVGCGFAALSVPGVAWAQDGGQVVPPEWWIRILMGALGGALAVARRYAAGTPIERAAVGVELLLGVVLGAGAGFVVIAAPVLAGSEEAWLAWSLVAGFSGPGVLGALAGRLEAQLQLRATRLAALEARHALESAGDAGVARAQALLSSVERR